MNRKTLWNVALGTWLAVIGSGLLVGGENPQKPAPLFERLGGMDAIRAVVGDFTSRIVADERVKPYFAHTAADPERFAAYREKLSDLVCQATGGPCEYKGMDMTSAHRGRAITSEAFDAVVEDLVQTLDRFKVPAKEKEELLGILGSLKPVVVQKQAPSRESGQ